MAEVVKADGGGEGGVLEGGVVAATTDVVAVSGDAPNLYGWSGWSVGERSLTLKSVERIAEKLKVDPVSLLSPGAPASAAQTTGVPCLSQR